MIRKVLLFVVIALAVWGFARAAFAEGPAFDLQPGTQVLEPVKFQQLAVFPIVQRAATPADAAQYLSLADGLRRKLVAVAEDPRGAQVNRVNVANHGSSPLLLLGGEIILGGQQDRILGKDTILPAGEEASLEVFCVEHGRWSGKREFHGSGGMVEGKTRMRAKYRSDQGQVWDEVAKKTAALKAQSATGTYRSLATGAEGERAVKPYRDAVKAALARLPESAKMVGVIAAVNGRVTSVDVFATPALFSAYRDQLLDSIFVSAADVPRTSAADKAPSQADIHAFVNNAEAAADEEVAKNKGGRTVEKKGLGVVNSKVIPAGASAKPVYQSYQSAE